MPIAQQFICNKCKALSGMQRGAKNKVVRAGLTPSQPGLLPVTGVIQ